jgi:NitT/TauT family transport system permease protein
MLTMYSLTVPQPTLLVYLYRSIYRFTIGYGLGAILGIAVGILMGINKHFYRMASPILSLLISVPTIAWVPLFLITVGIGDETIILAIFLGCFFAIVYNTMNGIRSINKELIWASKIMGAKKTTIFSKVLLPGASVSIITGLRLAVGYSWRALVGAEMLASISGGIGYLVYAARAFNAVNIMFTGLVIIALGGLIIDNLVLGALEKKTIEKWGMIKKRV